MELKTSEKIRKKDCGSGQMVSLLAFYFDNPSSNPTEVDSFNSFWKEWKWVREWPIKSCSEGGNVGD